MTLQHSAAQSSRGINYLHMTRNMSYTPVSNETKQVAMMLKNALRLTEEDPLVDVVPRTVQRWVDEYPSPDLTEQTGIQTGSTSPPMISDVPGPRAPTTLYQLRTSSK